MKTKINLNNIKNETEKALNLKVLVNQVATNAVIEWSVWIPKSQIENGEIPTWLYVEKCKEINEKIRGQIEVDFNAEIVEKVEQLSEKGKKAKTTRERNIEIKKEKEKLENELKDFKVNFFIMFKKGEFEAINNEVKRLGLEAIQDYFSGNELVGFNNKIKEII